MSSNHADVAVVGAGAIGCAIAYFLALERVQVHVLDQEAIGSGASGHATGLIGTLGNEFKPGPFLDMALESLNMYPDLMARLREESNTELYYQERPSLRMALDEEEEYLIKEMLAWQTAYVSDARWIDGDEVRQLDSRLTPKVRGAAMEPHTAQIDGYRLNLALAQSIEKRGLDVQLRKVTGLKHSNNKVTGVEYDGGSIECQSVVLAMGAWSNVCQEWLDFPIPVRPLKGERILLDFDAPPLPALLTSPKRGHLLTLADGHWSVGSTGGRDYDKVGGYLGHEFDMTTTEKAKLELMERGIYVLPELENARIFQQMAGSRPASPDRMPIIGPVPGWEGIYLAMGHTTSGIHLAPITARMIRDSILKGSPQESFDTTAFLPDRFADQWQPEFKSALEILRD